VVYDKVIVGSHVVHAGGITKTNIVIDSGRISALTNDVPPADTWINGEGLVSVPGPIDPHVHYGVYSPVDRAAETESHAAAIGGVTTMMRMLRLPGPFVNSLTEQLDAMARSHYIDYAVHASIFTPEQIGGMEFCDDNNVRSFKVYMNLGGEVGHVYMDMPPGTSELVPSTVDMNDGMVREIVREAARLHRPVLVHAEDYEMCGCGIRTARQKHLDGLSAWACSRPPESEAKAIRTVSYLCREYGCTVYFVHIGSAMALRQIREERKLGTCIYVETCPHYLKLSYEMQRGYAAKVMPPIRTGSDMESVWTAISDGTIDTIGTDHVANRLQLKLGGDDVWDALAGFPGVGTSIPILLNDGVNAGRITLERFAEITSGNAASIFGMPNKGRIGVGYDADIAMLDLKKEKKVTPDLFGGFSDYSVYGGETLRGWPVKTILRGEVVAEDFEVVGRLGYGNMVVRQAGERAGRS